MPNLTPEQIAMAREARKRGRSLDSIATELGCSRRSLSRQMADSSQVPSYVEPGHDDDDDDDDDGPDDDTGADDPALDLSALDLESQRVRLARIIRDEEENIATLMAAGEVAEARKCKDLLLRAENTLSRLNRSLPEGARIVTDQQLKEAHDSALNVIDTIAIERPNLCAHCSTQLALTWGEAVRKRGEA
jgi:hypothetical protein